MFGTQRKKGNQPRSLMRQHLKTGLQLIWNRAKRGFAVYLSVKTEHLSASRLKKYLYIFCAICSAASIGIFLYPFLEPRVPALLSSPGIRFPIHQDYPGGQKLVKDSSITYHQYQHILLLEKRLDSLQYSGRDKEEYDSLMKRYPGLPDSILLLKQLYQNQ